MEYSKNTDATPRKIIVPTRKSKDQELDSFDDIAALIIAEADANDRKPQGLSQVAYARILDALHSLDVIDVPPTGLGKIAPNDDLDNRPKARESQVVAVNASSLSPVRTSTPSSLPSQTSTSIPSPTPKTTPQATPRHAAQKQPVTAWKHLPEHHKFSEACRVAEELEGFVFSLDLSARVEKTLWTHKDPCRLLSTYINRALKDQGIAGTPFAFAVEYAPLEENYRGVVRSKLHLHGVVVSDDPGKVKAALMTAGGKITGKRTGRELDMKPFDAKKGGGIGWAVYALKDEDRTWRHIDGGRVMFINDPLRRLTQNRWEERRPVKRRQRKTAALTHTAPAALPHESQGLPAPNASQHPSMARSGIPALLAEVARVTRQKKALDQRDTSDQGLNHIARMRSPEARGRQRRSHSGIMIPHENLRRNPTLDRPQ